MASAVDSRLAYARLSAATASRLPTANRGSNNSYTTSWDTTGVGAGLVLPRCNTQAMQWHLDEISALVTPGAHAVLIIDRAGWHTTGRLEIPSNITLMFLPPRAPELNPVENIWQFMRDNWLSNRIFKTYDDIVALCCEAWNRLIDQPWKIMSIGRRKWAHGF